MSGMDHQATVDNRGLRMKIKRTKNMGPTSNKSDTKHEIVKSGDAKATTSSSSAASSSSSTDGISANGSAADKSKQSAPTDKDKSPKVKNLHKRERSKEKINKDCNPTTLSSVSSLDVTFSQVSLEPKQAEVPQGKKESLLPDPYEFNAKVEDGIGFPVKKIKSEKNDASTSSSSTNQHASTSTETCSVGVATEPECLGPCEPGTSVTLEGIVWHETENGVLVVNVTWRDKTYVGTLLDATKHDWAPPRFNCESPVSEFETRTPKGRAKRGRGSASSTPVNEKGPEGRKLRKGRKGSNTFQAPPSPAKSDISSSGGVKRKGRPTDIDLSSAINKRSRSCSQGTPGTESPVSTLIECPEPNCGKKYKHPNGLKYHQTHAHQNSGITTDGDDDTRDTCDNVEEDDVDSSVADPCDNVDTSAKPGKPEAMEEGTKKEDEGAKSDSENMDDVDVDIGEDTNKTDTADKKEPVVTTSVCVNKPAAKPITSIPSGNAFQIVSKQHIASPTFGSVGLLSQSPIQTGPLPTGQALPLVTAVVSTNPIQAGPSLTVAAITATAQPLDLKTESSKTEKPIRPKISHIMPQIVALSTTVSVTHTNVSPLTTSNMQGTSQLIPIQPKPTPPGETTSSTTPFLGLNRDRKPKQKKREKVKEKDSPSVVPPSNQNVNSVPLRTGKVEPLKNDQQQSAGVIKVAPIVANKSVDHTKSENSTITNAPRLERPDKPLSLSTSGANVGVVTAQVQPSPKGVDLSQTRQTEPPSMLKVNPSLAALDSKSNRNEEVQSPSYYSDISEESGSPATHPQSESPQKTKDEGLPKNRDSVSNVPNLPTSQPGGMDGQTVPPYMYGSYYGPPGAPYLMSPQNMSSPVGAGPGPNTPTQQPQPHSHHQSQPPHTHHQPHISSQTPNKDKSTTLEQSKVDPKLKRDDSKDSDTKDDRGEKSEAGRSLTQQEYHQIQHQKWVQQQMYALQIPPHAQYQFLATYGPYFDNAYHMHMMTNDPLYRQHHEQKMSEEDKNRQEGSGDRKEGDIHNKPVGKPSTSTDNGSSVSTDIRAPLSDGPQGQKDSDHKRGGSEVISERELKEKNIREKQNENHQIIKENLDLKDQMDRNRQDQRFEPMYGRDKTSEEQRRIQMYRQQAMIRHQKREEQQKKMGEGNKYDHRPSEPKSSVVSQAGNNSSAAESKPKDHGAVPDTGKPRMDIKREVEDKGYRDSSDANDTKVLSGDKLKSMTSSSSSSSLDRLRGHETSKSKSGSRVSSPHTPSSNPSSLIPSSMASPGPAGPPYPAYMYPSQYMQSSLYGQMPFEPSHPMYRGLNPMMYGAYLHPSQIPPYPVNMELDEKEKMGLVQKLNPAESDSKMSDNIHGPSLYHGTSGTSASNNGTNVNLGKSSGHKIHELQEKTRSVSSPHRSSPVPSGKAESSSSTPTHSIGPVDKNREYSSSPPTQRHVHTHHHTHVVEAAYPVGYYPGMFPGANQQKTPPAAAVQPQQGHTSYPPPK